MKNILAVLLFAAFAQAQLVYTAVYEVNLPGTAGATTIQQPASPTRNARLIAVKVYSSAAATVTLEHTGTAATTTASTSITKRPGVSTSPTLAYYTASNAGTGSAWDIAVIPGGSEKVWECTDENKSWCGLLPKLAGANWTVRFASMTGDVKVTWMWTEF